MRKFAFFPLAAALVLIAANLPFFAGATGTVMTFRDSHINIAAAETMTGAFGEPMIASGKTGVIYVSSHNDVAGHAPTFVTTNNGTSWSELSVTTEFGGDEGYVTADSTGKAWMLDNSGATLPLYKWCSDGTACGVTADIWDRTAATCTGTVADRPFIKYGNGKLLLTNNNGGTLSVGLVNLSNHDVTSWRNCVAGTTDSPTASGVGLAIRDSDGKLAIMNHLKAVDGNPARIRVKYGDSPSSLVDSPELFTNYVNGLSCTQGHAGGKIDFSSTGSLWGVVPNSTREISIIYSSSLSSWATFEFSPVGTGYSIGAFWLSASKRMDAALLTWSVAQGTPPNCTQDYYAGHLTVDSVGVVNLTNISPVATGVTSYCDDFQTSILDPAGNALVAMWRAPVSGDCPTSVTAYRPLHVYIQDAGPRK